ncbi:MAG: deoxyribonuclease IV [Acidobacteria bacterium]|nr:deoxyribonuclease IV [Acidobacteriota bacterium]
MPKKKRRLGAHTSIAGSLDNSAREAIELGCSCFQIFTRSPRMWQLDRGQIEGLKRLRKEHDLWPLAVHGSYLINLAALDEANRDKSIEGFRDELERAIAVGAEYLVFHPGSAKGQERDEAIAVLAKSFAKATRGLDWDGLEVLLENTAGGGASLGRTFEELAAVRAAIRAEAPNAPLGFCIDTCHTFAAGYDISTAEGLNETLDAIDSAIGLEQVKLIHANDSKAKFGSHLDRHENIGEGQIGLDAFRRIVNHPRLRDKPFILETPHDEDGTHRHNTETLKTLAQ